MYHIYDIWKIYYGTFKTYRKREIIRWTTNYPLLSFNNYQHFSNVSFINISSPLPHPLIKFILFSCLEYFNINPGHHVISTLVTWHSDKNVFKYIQSPGYYHKQWLLNSMFYAVNIEIFQIVLKVSFDMWFLELRYKYDSKHCLWFSAYSFYCLVILLCFFVVLVPCWRNWIICPSESFTFFCYNLTCCSFSSISFKLMCALPIAWHHKKHVWWHAFSKTKISF